MYILCSRYKKLHLLMIYVQHFKSDKLNNMGHMCISSTEPSSDPHQTIEYNAVQFVAK